MKVKHSLLRRFALATVLAVAAFALMGAGEPTDARYRQLGHEMMCMCGCGQILLECNHVGCSYSSRMTEELRAALAKGDSDQVILQGFVEKYGNTVLAAPTKSGFNLVAWIMPFVIFLLSLGAVILVVRTWKSRAAAQAAAGVPPVPSAEMDDFRQRARKETEF